MPKKAKITIEIPIYLKEWIDAHDVGQNAIATMALRQMYLQEKQADENLVYLKIKEFIEQKKLPF